MERIPEFIGNHPLLFSAVAAVIAMIVVLEVQRLRRVGQPLSPARATRMNNSEDAVFIDARKHKDFEQSHLPGARSIPAAEVEGHLKQIEKLRERPVIIYDEGGVDAERAAKQLARNGFTRLYVIDGGLPAWRKAELPTESGAETRKDGGGKSKGNKGKSRRDGKARS